jgi:NADH:ubiquinone oxidoreductase subunit 5 (subunit L)/multisubunit Na+/H+ antiporter MnhA subunit
MAIPLWVLALLALAVGVMIIPHPAAEVESPHWLAFLAIGVALAGIGLAWLTYGAKVVDAERLSSAFGPIRAAAERRYWLDDLFGGIYRGVILALSRLVGWTDRYLVDGVVNLFSAWTLMAGDRLRRIQSGRPQDYIYGVALGVLLLMFFSLSRWPR